MKRAFVLGSDVHENIRALRHALGSVARPLSFAALAELIGVGATSVQRWEKDGAEPDYESTRRMAELAEVSFEQFALGDPEKRADPFDSEDMGIPESPSLRPYTEEEAEERPAKKQAVNGKKPRR